jgi:hypothetical protein
MKKNEDIEELLARLRELYGAESIAPYGDGGDPESAGFRIHGIAATFSVISGRNLPRDHYNIQIDSCPPESLDLIYTNRAISLWDFLELVSELKRGAH